MGEAETKAFVMYLHTLNVLASVTQCGHCNEWGFYVLGKMKRPPMTCGRWACGAQLGETWAKGYVKGTQ